MLPKLPNFLLHALGPAQMTRGSKSAVRLAATRLIFTRIYLYIFATLF